MNEEMRMLTQWKREPVADDLITDYKSYLRERELLPFRPFHPKVFHALVKLAAESFWSDKKNGPRGLAHTH